MALASRTQPAIENRTRLERAILETLAYSDIFDYPLTMEELHRFLTVSAEKEEIRECVEKMDGVLSNREFYFLADRAELADIRNRRGENSRKPYRRALFYGRILGGLPFIRMAALTGSLAMLNLSKNRDMDYMLVARPGRVWTARAFALLFGRLARLFGDVICPNVIVSENALEWNARNMYTAREFAQMIPISGADVYRRLLEANEWIMDFLPNAFINSDGRVGLGAFSSPYRDHRVSEKTSQNVGLSYAGERRLLNQHNIFEAFLNGKLGDFFESWEMSRKIARFKKQKGYGVETNFSADLCQGNFDHHSAWALQAYEERLFSLSLIPNPSPDGEGSPLSLRERARVRVL